jgi:thiol-disulfide isomerase/thioredoxin
MKKISFFLIALLNVTVTYSQQKFEIKIKAPSYVGDSLLLSPPEIRIGFEDLYYFKLITNQDIIDMRGTMGEWSSYNLKIKSLNSLHGEIDSPIPVSFIHFGGQPDQMPDITNVFFLEKGNMEIELPKFSNKYQVKIDSPVNNEYRKLKSLLSVAYVKVQDPMMYDSLKNYDLKQKILSSYIQKNPNSYPALWQIIEDYSRYSNHPTYRNNLKYFSKSLQNSKLYKRFIEKLNSFDSSQAGSNLPLIKFKDSDSLTVKDFSNSKLTLISYWSTTCRPCIQSMPELVLLYEKLKNNGFNVISIADDNTIGSIEMANKILIKNKAKWQNHFDLNSDFKSKVNATSLPLYFLVDENGKILDRNSDGFQNSKKRVEEIMKF